MEPFPLIMIVIGALMLLAGFVYALSLRKQGGVKTWSQPFWLMTITVGLGAGICVGGLNGLFS